MQKFKTFTLNLAGEKREFTLEVLESGFTLTTEYGGQELVVSRGRFISYYGLFDFEHNEGARYFRKPLENKIRAIICKDDELWAEILNFCKDVYKN